MVYNFDIVEFMYFNSFPIKDLYNNSVISCGILLNSIIEQIQKILDKFGWKVFKLKFFIYKTPLIKF